MTHPTPTSPQESTVEELAKALCAAFRSKLEDAAEWDFIGEDAREGYREEARRAISLLTRPSVDEEFVRAAKALRNEASSAWATLLHHTIDGVNDELRHSIVKHLRSTINDVDAALASVEGKVSDKVGCTPPGERVTYAGSIGGIPFYCDPSLPPNMTLSVLKPAQPTAVDERRVREIEVSTALNATSISNVIARLELVESALERAQAKPVETDLLTLADELASCADDVITEDDSSGELEMLLGNALDRFKRARRTPPTPPLNQQESRTEPTEKQIADMHGQLAHEAMYGKPTVKGEAVAGWVPSGLELQRVFLTDNNLAGHSFTWNAVRLLISKSLGDEKVCTFMGRPFLEWQLALDWIDERSAQSSLKLVERLERISQRAPRVDVRRLLNALGLDPDDEHMRNLARETLAKQSIPTAEVGDG